MVKPADFQRAIRYGSRAGNPAVVVHCRTDEEQHPPLVGFVVAKKQIPLATGRNRVRRQLRHLMAERVKQFPTGTAVVIRVNAPALGQTSTELAGSLDNAINRAMRKTTAKGTPGNTR